VKRTYAVFDEDGRICILAGRWKFESAAEALAVASYYTGVYRSLKARLVEPYTGRYLAIEDAVGEHV
jgi:hypothetical protein